MFYACVRHETAGCVVLDVYDSNPVDAAAPSPTFLVVMRDDVSAVYTVDQRTGESIKREIATPGGLTVFLTRQRRSSQETAQRLQDIGVLDE